ncbi:unnamed protein product [Microthlaspi erraticum]|uniref:Uncharacterized protein n=1 Tax=Microthlaspi erraticum TaxID=1685480 RepID=A0A6D2HRC0_9BRAS|nr:unnamed protein product [Microthlaspi erraticum]CAA7062123.1 unnamed protein product [Microthlaspi erraticum]
MGSGYESYPTKPMDRAWTNRLVEITELDDLVNLLLSEHPTTRTQKVEQGNGTSMGKTTFEPWERNDISYAITLFCDGRH